MKYLFPRTAGGTVEAPPGGMSPDELEEMLDEHIEEHYEPDERGGYVCKECGGQIKRTALNISIHAAAFGALCAGVGQVVNKPLPYCPKCEGEPKKTTTCVHV